MRDNGIWMIKGSHYKEMTKKLLDLSCLAQRIPSEKSLVGIKPNLLGPVSASEGATTHPEVAAGLIEYLQEHGFRNIVMMESSWVGDRTEDALLVCGFDRIAEKYHVPFWDLQKDESAVLDCAGMKLEVCKKALLPDFRINVPVLKGHCQTRMTCALKNWKGLLPSAEKRRFHRMGLHEPIGHLSAGVRQDFILADCICPDPVFEDGGHPVLHERLIAAADPVLCDSFGCSLMGISPDEVGYIGVAEECGVGKSHLKNAFLTFADENGEILFSGNADKGAGKYALSGAACTYRKILKLQETVDSVDSCSGCWGKLLPVLERLDREGRLDKIRETICIGQGYRGKKGSLGIGSCTRDFERFLPGCPPEEDAIYDFLTH